MRSVSPRGIVAALLVFVVAAVCIRLGIWQLDRLDQRRERNTLLAAAMEAPVLRLNGDSLAAVVEDPEAFAYRRVTVQGEYEDRGTALLRGRAQRGTPGVHLVTPLRIPTGDAAVLIDRGWVPAADALSVDPAPYRLEGPVTVEGHLRPLPPGSPDDAGAFTVEVNGTAVPTYQRLNLDTLQADSPVSLLPFYVERSADDADGSAPPVGVPPPTLDEGPHLGYAIQWFSFAAIAVIGFAVVVLRSPRRG